MEKETSISNVKPIVFCGVYNPFNDNEIVKITKEEQENFAKMCSNNGEYNAIFVENHKIIEAMALTELVSKAIK